MALSYVTYIGDGATTAYNYGSIQLLQSGVVPVVSQLVVSVGGTDVPPSTYSINSDTKTITFFTAPGADATIKIARVTKDDDRYVDWTNSTNLSQEQLNLDSDQLFFLAQESIDNSGLTIRENELGQWEAQDKIIQNVDDGVDSHDAVNVQQLNAAIFGGTPGSVTGQKYVRSDDGTTVFTLQSLYGQKATDVNVFKNGIKMTPEDDYTVADSADGSSLLLTLTSDPGSNLVEITFVTGIMAAGLAEDAIENNNIQDGVITPDKLRNPGSRKLIINNPAFGPEWSTLEAGDVNAALTGDLPTHALSELGPPVAPVDMGNVRITSVADPLNNQDGVNLQTLQDEIASVRQQISDTTDFKVGTIAGQLVRIQSSNNKGIGGQFFYWFDQEGKDEPPSYNGSLDGIWFQALDWRVTLKDDTDPYSGWPDGWPLDPDLTFLAKIPSPGTMDMDLFTSFELPEDWGRFSPGGNPQSGLPQIPSFRNKILTTGGKQFGMRNPAIYESTIDVRSGNVMSNAGKYTRTYFPFYRLA